MFVRLPVHFMPSLIRKLFHKSEAPNDGLTQPQREAIVDLLNYCMYADNLIFLAEDRVITDTVAKFNWNPKVPFDQFDVRSIDNARNATENKGYRDRFLASIRDRLALLKSLDAGRRWKIEWPEFVNVVGQTEQESLFALRGERTARCFGREFAFDRAEDSFGVNALPIALSGKSG